MDTIKIYAAYMPEFHAYCVSDNIVNGIISAGKIPEIYLRDEDFSALGGNFINTPTIGFLMGRENGYYSIDYNYAKSIALSGAKIKLITYESVRRQMMDIDGLLLPGGAFSSPDEFYGDNIKEYKANKRFEAYETAIIVAKKLKIPMLGICAGAQMIAALSGAKLDRDVQKNTTIMHKTKKPMAHWVKILPNSPLAKMFVKKTIATNSRHKEALSHIIPPTLKLYAVAEDGTPEAWGLDNEKILCIQWHPEDFAVNGNKEMLGIYKWLTQKATFK